MFLILFEAEHYCEHKIPVQILFSLLSSSCAAQINFPANYLPPRAFSAKCFTSGPFQVLFDLRDSPFVSHLFFLIRPALMPRWRSVILNHLGRETQKQFGHGVSLFRGRDSAVVFIARNPPKSIGFSWVGWKLNDGESSAVDCHLPAGSASLSLF